MELVFLICPISFTPPHPPFFISFSFTLSLSLQSEHAEDVGAHMGHGHGKEVAARLSLFWRLRVPRFIHLHASVCALRGLKAFQCMSPHNRTATAAVSAPNPPAKKPRWKARMENKSWWSCSRESESILNTACVPHPSHPLGLLPRFSSPLSNEASAAATHSCRNIGRWCR